MDDLIQLRVASTEKRRLIETAEKTGMTLSDFIRTATQMNTHAEAPRGRRAAQSPLPFAEA